jgi:hypothetical protein
MSWAEPILLEREYHIGAGRMKVVSRIGFPRPTDREKEWACSFQLSGWNDDRVHVAHGADGLQAITIAASTIRQWLDSAGDVTSDEAPYEVVFPRYVPFCYGIDFHRNLCKILDKEIEKKKNEIERPPK